MDGGLSGQIQIFVDPFDLNIIEAPVRHSPAIFGDQIIVVVPKRKFLPYSGITTIFYFFLAFVHLVCAHSIFLHPPHRDSLLVWIRGTLIGFFGFFLQKTSRQK